MVEIPLAMNLEICAMRNYALTHAGDFEAAGHASLFGNLIRNWKARRAVARLDRLDDRLLSDIGVTRSDVRWAASLPLATNASISLEERSRQRRTGRFKD
jgi:uncharacterized protein YjiS (DUF1127 family)